MTHISMQISELAFLRPEQTMFVDLVKLVLTTSLR